MSAPGPLDGVTAASFDLDGTLYPTRGLRFRVAAEALRQCLGGWSAAPFADLATLRRSTRRAEEARRRGGRLDEDWRSGIAARLTAEEHLLLPVLARLGPAPGAVALIQALRRRVGRLVVVSDYEPAAKLAALGLDGRFDRLFAAESVGRLKPDPAIFRQALADLGIAPNEMLHLGDRPDTDGAAAAAAGCRALIRGRDFPSFPRLAADLTG